MICKSILAYNQLHDALPSGPQETGDQSPILPTILLIIGNHA